MSLDLNLYFRRITTPFLITKFGKAWHLKPCTCCMNQEIPTLLVFSPSGSHLPNVWHAANACYGGDHIVLSLVKAAVAALPRTPVYYTTPLWWAK